MPDLCRKGHELTPENMMKNGRCKACGKEYRAANKHIFSAWYADNKLKVKEYGAVYRAENKERIKKRNADYSAKNKEKLNEKSKLWARAHPAEIKKRSARWASKNPDNKRDRNQKYRARQRGVFVEPVKRSLVYERDGWVCGICGDRVDKKLKYPHTKSASLDHIVPISEGGLHEYKNMQLAHFGCNSGKCNRKGNDQLRLF